MEKREARDEDKGKLNYKTLHLDSEIVRRPHNVGIVLDRSERGRKNCKNRRRIVRAKNFPAIRKVNLKIVE